MQAGLHPRAQPQSRKARPAAAAELRRALTAWLREVGAERPRPYAEIPAGELPGKKRR